jgi:hypothetical protein
MGTVAGFLPESILSDTAADVPATPNGAAFPPRFSAMGWAAGLSGFSPCCQGGIPFGGAAERPPDSLELTP